MKTQVHGNSKIRTKSASEKIDIESDSFLSDSKKRRPDNKIFIF